MFFFVSLKSNNKTLNSLMNIQLLGPLLIIFYAFLPLVLIGAWGDLTDTPNSQIALLIGSILIIPWNKYLNKLETEITIFKAPVWGWAIFFFLIILLGEIN